jgi:hypothetical protein
MKLKSAADSVNPPWKLQHILTEMHFYFHGTSRWIEIE